MWLWKYTSILPVTTFKRCLVDGIDRGMIVEVQWYSTEVRFQGWWWWGVRW
jgi:hypothetical protein